MDAGQIMEWDEPHVLLQNSKSLFKTMVDTTGPSASRKLFQMALEAHLSKKTTQ